MALEYFGASLLERSLAARFILLVTVFESLAEQGDRNEHEMNLLNEWKATIPKPPPDGVEDYYKSIRGSLKHWKHLSVGAAVRNLLDQHFEPDVAKRFGEIYQSRSDLVHSGVVPEGFRTMVSETSALAADLLEAPLNAESV